MFSYIGLIMRTHRLDADSWHVLQRLLTPANALVVEVMLSTGLRVSDVLQIKTAQIRCNRLTVAESKTGKRRRVYLRQDLWRRLRDQAGAVYVFEGARDPERHRTRQAVWHDIKRASVAMRLPQVVGCHGARKSYACKLYERSGDIDAVCKALNHDSIYTTVIYLLDLFDSQLPPI